VPALLALGSIVLFWRSGRLPLSGRVAAPVDGKTAVGAGAASR
jgi:hypothetical protein